MNDGDHERPAGPKRAVPVTEADIAAAARRVFLDRSMVRPGPGLLPFGRRARTRRRRRQEIADEHARRRRDLGLMLRSRRDMRARPRPAAPRERSRAARLRARAVLALVALAVLLFGYLHGRDPAAPTDPHPPASDPSARSVARESVPLSGTAAVTAAVAGPDSTSATAVMSWWLARWCPFDYRNNPTTLVEAARPAMTTQGWQQFSTQQTTAFLARWADVEQGRQTARCEHVLAARSLETRPAVDGTVVVIATATRTVSSPGRGWFTDTVVAQRRVVPVGAGWLVDVAERGV